MATSDNEKADTLNKFFSSVFTRENMGRPKRKRSTAAYRNQNNARRSAKNFEKSQNRQVTWT
jgi:hypothetical protein